MLYPLSFMVVYPIWNGDERGLATPTTCLRGLESVLAHRFEDWRTSVDYLAFLTDILLHVFWNVRHM